MSAEKSFAHYLRGRRLAKTTIAGYERLLAEFLQWLNENGRTASEIVYTDLLDYVKHCTRAGQSRRLVCSRLGVIRHYYNFLKYYGQIENSPATGLYIRGRSRTIPHDLLSEEQMSALYAAFDCRRTYRGGPSWTQRACIAQRNKVLFGLLLYQALTIGELEKLELRHLRLREGRIEIPGARRSNARCLALQAHQILDLQEYITKTRLSFMEQSAQQTDKLFIRTCKSDQLYGIIKRLISHLRHRYDYFTGAAQLRQSRIAVWVRQYDIRQVQYMAGHKYVSSTERYQRTNLEELQKELEKKHPLEDGA